MERQISPSQIKLFNRTLGEMNDAGYDLGQDDIAFIWKVALGVASQAELDGWTNSTASRLGHKPLTIQACEAFKSCVQVVTLDITRIVAAFESVSKDRTLS